MQQRPAGAWEHGVRLLVESTDPVHALSDFRRFHDAGFAVAWCAGPDESDPCPLTDGLRCPLVDWADVVLCALSLDQEPHHQAMRSLRRAHPDLPVVVPSPRTRDRRWFEATKGWTRLRHGTSVRGQIRLLHRAARESPYGDR